jgi:hypothetical protein
MQRDEISGHPLHKRCVSAQAGSSFRVARLALKDNVFKFDNLEYNCAQKHNKQQSCSNEQI